MGGEMEMVGTKLPAEVVERLDAEADRRGLKRSALVRAFILEGLGRKWEPGGELVEESGALTAAGGEAMADAGRERGYVPPVEEVPAVSDVALPNAIQLSNRTGLPKANCQQLLDRGLVRWRNRPESSDDVLEINYRGEWQRA
jgi:hypothetical protein